LERLCEAVGEAGQSCCLAEVRADAARAITPDLLPIRAVLACDLATRPLASMGIVLTSVLMTKQV
jgi:hypothetical protein